MFAMLKFEMKKFFKNKLSWILLILAFIACGYILNGLDVVQDWGKYGYLYPRVTIYEMNLNMAQHELKNPPNISNKEEAERRRQCNQAIVDVVNAYWKGDYQEYYRNDIIINEYSLYMSKKALEQNSSSASVMADNKIALNVISLDKILAFKNLTLMEETFCSKGFNSLRRFINEKFMLIVIILCVGVCVPMFAGEVENKTYKLLYTQGISKTRIFLGKLLSAITIICGFVIAICFSVLIYRGIRYGFGSPEYVFRAFKGGNLVCMSNIAYILYELLIVFLVVLTVCSMILLMSCLLNNVGICTFASAILLVSWYIFTKQQFIPALGHFNIFNFIRVNELVNGITIPGQKNPGISTVMEDPLRWCPVFSVVLIITGIVYFKRKRIT